MPRASFTVTPDPRLLEPIAADILAAAQKSEERFHSGEPDAERQTLILDALYLAFVRPDPVALKKLEAWAMSIVRTRDLKANAERWSAHHAGWSGNPVLIRTLVDCAQKALALLQGVAAREQGASAKKQSAIALSIFAHEVRKLVPQFLTRDEARFTAFVAGLEPLARKYSSSPMLFAERALVAAGMPAAEAHERFTFLRVKSSRDAKAKQSRARKAPSPRSTPRR